MNYAESCKGNYVVFGDGGSVVIAVKFGNMLEKQRGIAFYILTKEWCVHNYIYMNRKRQKLQTSGTLNRNPKQVKDPLFEGSTFFDAEDLVQVKYEMLRKVLHQGDSVSEASRLFGFSRPSFYKAQAAVESEGLSGLIPQKPGPRAGHKLTEEVLEFVSSELACTAEVSPTALAELIEERFGTRVHPRSIERALRRKKKQRRSDGE